MLAKLTLHRNPLLNQQMPNAKGDLQRDEMQPRYELEFDLPDVPARPKFFRHTDTDEKSAANNLHKYSYSSIEMTQELKGAQSQIYTDYNMGIRPNLVDREHYKAELAPLSEKLKFVLSNQDHFDPYEGQKKQKKSRQCNVPASFVAFDKIERFGGKIADPFAINVEAKEEIEARVFTSKHEKDKK